MSLIRNGSVLQKPVFVSWWHLWAWQCVDIRKHSLQWQGRLDNPPQLLSIHHSWQNLPGGTRRYTWRWQLQITARQHISRVPRRYFTTVCHREQTQHLLQPQPMPPAALSPFTSSSEAQSMWHIYATSVLSNTAFFFSNTESSAPVQALLMSWRQDLSFKKQFHSSLLPPEFHCVTTSLAQHSKQSFFFCPHLMSPHHIK